MINDIIENYRRTTIKVLQEQVEVFRSRLEPLDFLRLHTTISTLEHRIEELKNPENPIVS